jgi:hypothetical protein
MQFKLVAFGLALLAIGLVAYALVPSVHTTPIVKGANVWVQNGFPVQPGTRVEQPRNVTIFPGVRNELRTNITATEPGAGASVIRFELLAMNNSQSCSPSTYAPTVLIDRSVTNASFEVPLRASGVYCFVFDNQSSQTMKNIDISARVSGTAQEVSVSRDGTANTAGLGLGALGLGVALYGCSRKTIIPWE